MYLAKALWCKASVTLWSTAEERVEEEAEEDDTSQYEGYRDPRDADTTTTKDHYGELPHRSKTGLAGYTTY